MFIAHRLAPHLQREDLTAANDIAQRNAIQVFYRFQGKAGSNAPQKREALAASTLWPRGKNIDGSAAVVRPLQQSLVLQIRNVLVHGSERPQIQAMSNLLKGRRISVALNEAGDKVQHFFLSTSHGHSRIVANKKRIENVFRR